MWIGAWLDRMIHHLSRAIELFYGVITAVIPALA